MGNSLPSDSYLRSMFSHATGTIAATLTPFGLYGNGAILLGIKNMDGTAMVLAPVAKVDETMVVYPVINIKPTAELSTDLPEGCTNLDGTEACPYIIKTN